LYSAKRGLPRLDIAENMGGGYAARAIGQFISVWSSGEISQAIKVLYL
jgi:hypothetical protein